MSLSDLYNPKWHNISINSSSTKIYSNGHYSSLTIIDFEHKSYFKPDIPNIGYYGRTVEIDGILHIIGGEQSNKHYVLDTNDVDSGLKEVHQFKNFKDGLAGHQIMYVPTRREILLFGRYNYFDESRSDEIWIFSVDAQQWIKSSVTMPEKVNNFGLLLTLNEKYLLLFGGVADENSYDIYIFDLVNMTLPYYTQYHAVNCFEPSQQSDKLFRFIRGYCRDIHVPLDIMQLIMLWYPTENVLLLSEGGYLWKMKMQDIMNDSVSFFG